MPGYENMLTGSTEGERTNPHRNNVYSPHDSSSAARMPPPRQQMYAGYADPNDDDREICYNAREYPMNRPPPPRTPQRLVAREQSPDDAICRNHTRVGRRRRGDGKYGRTFGLGDVRMDRI